MKKKLWIIKVVSPLISIGFAVLLGSCAGTHPWVPEGFAVYQNSKCEGVCAVTPEGVTWRVHKDVDQPQADVQFWKEALRKRMTEAGYHVLDSVPFSNQGAPGWALVLEAPLGQTDYTYLVGAVVRGRELIVIEAAGATSDFALHRENLFAALSKATSN